MTDSGSSRTLGPKALEMIMRDVLGGMEELALLTGYQPGAGTVEIIAVDRPTSAATGSADDDARVVAFARPRRRRAS